MDLEVSHSAADLSVTAAADEMTIDYDVVDPSRPDDAIMGDEQPQLASPSKDLADLHGLEADMIDDEPATVSGQAAEVIEPNGEASIVIEEDAVTFEASSAPEAPSFPAVDETLAPALSPAAVASAALLDEVEFAAPADPILAEPASELSADESAATAPPLIGSAESSAQNEAFRSVGDGGAAASALETLDELEHATEGTWEVAEMPESATAEVAQEPESVATQDDAPNEGFLDSVVETAHHEEAADEVELQEPAFEDAVGSPGGDEVSGASPEHDQQPHTSPDHRHGNSLNRLAIDTDPLRRIEIPHAGTGAGKPINPESGGVPVCFLDAYERDDEGRKTWTLFQPVRAAWEAEEEPVHLVLGDASRHDLYYQPLEALFLALRDEFSIDAAESGEMVLNFHEIDLQIGEDNVYASQVSLYDFDRINATREHAGRLVAHLEWAPRFGDRFISKVANAARLYVLPETEDHEAANEAEEEPLEGEYSKEDAEAEQAEKEDESGTLQLNDDHDDGRQDEALHKEDGGSGGQDEIPDAEDAEEAADDQLEGPADDHDGPDSALIDSHQAESDLEHESEQVEEDDDDDFDLESALAQLDRDDVVAVIEGAQEDLLLGADFVGGDQDAQEEVPEETTTSSAQVEEGEPEAEVQEALLEENVEAVEVPAASNGIDESDGTVTNTLDGIDEFQVSAADVVHDADGHDADVGVDEQEQADVVIDYDDATGGAAEAVEVLLEPKRIRDDDEDDGADDASATDAKRPRLSDSIETAAS